MQSVSSALCFQCRALEELSAARQLESVVSNCGKLRYREFDFVHASMLNTQHNAGLTIGEISSVEGALWEVSLFPHFWSSQMPKMKAFPSYAFPPMSHLRRGRGYCFTGYWLQLLTYEQGKFLVASSCDSREPFLWINHDAPEGIWLEIPIHVHQLRIQFEILYDPLAHSPCKLIVCLMASCSLMKAQMGPHCLACHRNTQGSSRAPRWCRASGSHVACSAPLCNLSQQGEPDMFLSTWLIVSCEIFA